MLKKRKNKIKVGQKIYPIKQMPKLGYTICPECEGTAFITKRKDGENNTYKCKKCNASGAIRERDSDFGYEWNPQCYVFSAFSVYGKKIEFIGKTLSSTKYYAENGIRVDIPEEDLFTDEKEAVEECKKRNESQANEVLEWIKNEYKITDSEVYTSDKEIEKRANTKAMYIVYEIAEDGEIFFTNWEIPAYVSTTYIYGKRETLFLPILEVAKCQIMNDIYKYRTSKNVVMYIAFSNYDEAIKVAKEDLKNEIKEKMKAINKAMECAKEIQINMEEKE